MIGVSPGLLRWSHNRRPRRFRHAFAHKKARMRRLVIGDVLPRDAQPILGVVHQRIEPTPGRNGGRINPQFLVVGRAPDHFLAPITQNVGAQRGRGLRAVVRPRPVDTRPCSPALSSSTLPHLSRPTHSVAPPPHQNAPKWQGRRSPVELFSPRPLHRPAPPALFPHHSLSATPPPPLSPPP